MHYDEYCERFSFIDGVPFDLSQFKKINEKYSIFDTKLVINQTSFRCYQYKHYLKYGMIRSRSSYSKSERVFGPRTNASLSRTRNHIYDIINCNVAPYTKFMTLTFRENVQDFCIAGKAINHFLLNFKRQFGFSLKYIKIIEFQKRGAIHYHFVIFNTPKLEFEYLKKSWSQYGSVDIKVIDKPKNVSRYVAKYVSKDLLQVPSNKRIWTCSRGLKRPLIMRLFSEDYKVQDFSKFFIDNISVIPTFKRFYPVNYTFYESGKKPVEVKNFATYTFFEYALLKNKRGGAPFGGVGVPPQPQSLRSKLEALF